MLNRSMVLIFSSTCNVLAILPLKSSDVNFCKTTTIIRFSTYRKFTIPVVVACLSFFFLFLTPRYGKGQNFVQIGNQQQVPTTWHFLPMGGQTTAHLKFQTSNTLFTAAELLAAGITRGMIIDSVAFNKVNNTFSNQPSVFNMFMGPSNRTAPLSNITWTDVLVNKSNVINNPSFLLPSNTGWVNFPFSQPYTYMGGNLEIATKLDLLFNPVFSGQVFWAFSPGFVGNTQGFSTDFNFNPNTLLASSTVRNRTDIRFYVRSRPQLDASLVLVQPLVQNLISLNTTPFLVRLVNNGIDTIRTVQLNLQLNQDSIYQFVTNLSLGVLDTFTITLPFNVVIPNTANVAVKAWLSMVNGQGNDLVSQNDTIVRNICPTLPVGNVLVGGNQVISTMQQALDRVMCAGLGGNTKLILTENDTASYVLGSFPQNGTFELTITGVDSQVTLTNASNQYLMHFQNARGITVENLKIVRNPSFPFIDGLIRIANCQFIKFTHNQISGNANQPVNNYTLLRIDQSSDVTLTGNTFSLAQNAYSATTNDSNAVNSRHTLSANRFFETGTAIGVFGPGRASQLIVARNEVINNNYPNINAEAIVLERCQQLTLESNLIRGKFGKTVFTIRDFDGTGISSRMFNNRVAATFSSAAPNILNLLASAQAGNSNDFLRIVHNTFYMQGFPLLSEASGVIQFEYMPSSGSATAYPAFEFINNVVAITDADTNTMMSLLHFPNRLGVNPIFGYSFNFRHNFYEHVHHPLARIGSTLYSGITSWQTRITGGFELNSSSGRARLISVSNGNFMPSTGSPLRSRAIASPTISFPIDALGNSRLTPPSIGAVEFQPQSLAAIITRTISPALQDRIFADSTFQLSVVLRNSGLSRLDSVQMCYQFENQPIRKEKWTGTLNSGDSTVFTFSIPFTVNDSSFYHPLLKCWFDLPNGQVSPSLESDTSHFLLRMAFPGGTYTVGGPSSDYPNLEAWRQLLRRSGASKPTTFKFEIPGKLLLNQAVSIDSLPATGPAALITIDGQGDTLRNTSVSSNNFANIRILRAKQIHIKNFYLEARSNRATASNIWMNEVEDVRISHILIRNQAQATGVIGILASFANNATWDGNVKNLVIDSNDINTRNHAVLISGTTNGNSNIVIAHNKLNPFVQVISANNLVFESNIVESLRNNNQTVLCEFLQARGLVVRKNIIRDHVDLNSNTALPIGITGIAFFGSDSIKPVIIDGNLIYNLGSNTSAVGISARGFSPLQFIGNTVALYDKRPSGSTTGILMEYANQGLDIRNNNISIQKNSPSVQGIVAFSSNALPNTPRTDVVINNNNYHVMNLGGFMDPIQVGATKFSSLSSFRALFPNFDSLSYQINPAFTHPWNGLFQPGNPVLQGAGSMHPGDSLDLFGTLRPIPPSIGAIEYVAPSTGVKLAEIDKFNTFCMSSLQQPLIVHGFNMGTNRIDSLFLTYQNTTNQTVTELYTGSVAPRTAFTHTFGQLLSLRLGNDTVFVYARAHHGGTSSLDTLPIYLLTSQSSFHRLPYAQNFERPQALEDFCIEKGDLMFVAIDSGTAGNTPILTGSANLLLRGQTGSIPAWVNPNLNNLWQVNPARTASLHLNVIPNRPGRLRMSFKYANYLNGSFPVLGFRILVNDTPVTPSSDISITQFIDWPSSLFTYNLDSLNTGDTMRITFQVMAAGPAVRVRIDSLRIFEPAAAFFDQMTRVNHQCDPAPETVSIQTDVNGPAFNNPTLHYRTSTTNWSSIPMTAGAAPGRFEANVPAFPVLSDVQYHCSLSSGGFTYYSDTLSFIAGRAKVDLGPDVNITIGSSVRLEAKSKVKGLEALRIEEYTPHRFGNGQQASWPTSLTPTSTDDLLEIGNFGADTVSLDNIIVHYFAQSGNTFASVRFPEGVLLAPGERATLCTFGAGTNDFVNKIFFVSTNLFLQSTVISNVVLRSFPAGTFIDGVVLNDTAFMPGMNVPPGTWSGILNTSNFAGVRRLNLNSTSASAWQISSAANPTQIGVLNSSLNFLPDSTNILWFNGSTPLGSGTSIVVSPINTTTYRVTTNIRGCQTSDTIVVNATVSTVPDLTISRFIVPSSTTTSFNGQIAPQVRVVNLNPGPCPAYDVLLQANGQFVAVASSTQPLGGNDSIDFQLPVWTTVSGIYDLCAIVQLPNDANNLNNQLCFNGIQLTDVTSVFENRNIEIQVFPNPANNILKIGLPENLSEIALNITDSKGRIVASFSYPENTEEVIEIQTSYLSEGLYMLHLHEKNGRIASKRFVIMR